MDQGRPKEKRSVPEPVRELRMTIKCIVWLTV